jgi:histidinol-phosphate aminotransferase
MTIFNQRAIQLQPYVVSKRFEGRHDGEWLFLDWNETTYELPVSVKEKLKDAIDRGLGVSYPDGDRDDVHSALHQFTGVPLQNILVFNGSDSALKDCIECLLDPGDEISVVEPEYSQINTYIQMAAGKLDRIKFPNPFEVTIEDLIFRLKGKKTLYLSNPSNPTGRYLSKFEIKKLLDTGICLLLDEAYVEFAPESCANLVQSYRNLFVFRTFSKAFGMAGLRLGYVLSHEENIEILRKNRNSKEINSFAQIAVVEALKNLDIYKNRIKEIIEVREQFVAAINTYGSSVRAFKSMGNFVLIKSSRLTELLRYLEDNKILIRDRRGMYFMDECARISIGTPEQMRRVTILMQKFFTASDAPIISHSRANA